MEKLTLEQRIAQRNKEIADKEQEIKEAKKKGVTEQELFLLNHQLNTLKCVGNPSVTSEQVKAQLTRARKASEKHHQEMMKSLKN